MNPRVRAAHLGELTVEGRRVRVTFRNGPLRFRPLRAHSEVRTRALPLEDAYALAERQQAFALFPR